MGKDSSGNIEVISIINDSEWFNKSGATYISRYFSLDVLTEDTTNKWFTFTDSLGRVTKFFNFDSSIPAAKQGQFMSYTDQYGSTFTPTYNGSNQVTALSAGSSPAVSYNYDYYTSGSNSGRIQYVTLKRGSTNVRRLYYTYYDSGSGNGLIGDLRTETLEQWNGSSWDNLGTSYFRYYTSDTFNATTNPGFSHGLKFVLGPEAFDRATTGGSTDPDTISDSSLKNYSDNYFEFTSDKRVSKEVVNGPGTPSSSSTSTYGYSYAVNTPSSSSSNNFWTKKTTETLPDGDTQTVYCNSAGQKMVTVLEDVGTGNKWNEALVYDAQGRVVQEVSPEAIASVSEAVGGLVTLNTSTGLIRLKEYYTSTDLANGAVDNYLRYEKIKKGSSGSEIKVREYKYTSRSNGSKTIYPIWKDIVYNNDAGGGTDPAETTYDYTFFTGSLQIEQKTTTWPAITTAQNGSNTGNTKVERYDQYGNLIWVKDERGFLTRFKYDTASGGLLQRIDDVATGQISDSPSVPSGWTTPSGGGLHLITDYTVDNLGRTTVEKGPEHNVAISGTATDIRRIRWTIYKDSAFEVRSAQGYETVPPPSSSSTTSLIEPVSVEKVDKSGRVTDSIQTKRDPAKTGALTSSEDVATQSRWLRWRKALYNNNIRKPNRTRTYWNIPATNGDEGNSTDNYNETIYGFDSSGMGWLVRQVSPGGTIIRWVYTANSQEKEKWIGTDDTGATDSDPSNSGAGGNNMVKVEAYEYDSTVVGKNGNLTKITQFVDSNSSNDRATTFGYDWRNRRISKTGELSSCEIYTYDNLDRMIKTEQKNGFGGNLIGLQETSFDNLGRVFRTKVYAVNPSTGSIGNSLVNDFWYDACGQTLKTKLAGSSTLQKFAYNGAGWALKQYRTLNTSDDTYSEAAVVTGDTVLEQVEFLYDDAKNLIQTTTRQRFHNATGVGELDGTSTEPRSRVSYKAFWSDAVGRESGICDYGTNGGSALSRPSTIPARSDTRLVTTTAYNQAGEPYQVTDPKAIVTQSAWDDAGRLTSKIEDYGVSGINRETQFAYDADDHLVTLTAVNAITGNQTTKYIYGTALSNSEVASNDLLRCIIHPDSSDTDPTGTDQVKFEYNRLGQLIRQTDQLGTVHVPEYDKLGRLAHDRITTFGTGVDQTVKRISRTYEIRGMLENLTSYDNAAVGSGTIVNQLLYVYNTFNLLTTEYQSHSGAVITGTSPKVQYSYADGSANHTRLLSVNYPDTKVITYDYGSIGGTDDLLCRVTALKDSTTTLVGYSYLGINTIVRANYSSQPGVELTYIKQGAEGNGDAGDQYTGLDRFGRVYDQRWLVTSSGSALERIQYGFDRSSNRIFRDNLVAGSGQDEYYSYDNVNQITSLKRGDLNGGRTDIAGTPAWQENFTLDPTGNWHGGSSGYINRTNGVVGLDQNRSNNKVNEVTGITTTTGTAWSVPAYNAVGDMTTLSQPGGLGSSYTAKYDAWNRLVELKSGGAIVASYSYDAAQRRITKLVSTTTTHFYYSNRWQILEERLNSATTADRQFVWGLRYIDDLVLRDQGSTRHYVLHDYFNVTAIINTSGTVQERYGFDSFGATRVMDASFGARGSSSYGWETRYGAYHWDAESGLYHVRHRVYHPLLGLWISRDLLQGEFRLYLYCENNPVNSVDFTGLIPVPNGVPSALWTIIQKAVELGTPHIMVQRVDVTTKFDVECPSGCSKKLVYQSKVKRTRQYKVEIGLGATEIYSGNIGPNLNLGTTTDSAYACCCPGGLEGQSTVSDSGSNWSPSGGAYDEYWYQLGPEDKFNYRWFSAVCKNPCYTKKAFFEWSSTVWNNGVPSTGGGREQIYP
ncbi:MAG: RHS repeat-associated core domain-containing protein [Verrucomicrobiota bacterium]